MFGKTMAGVSMIALAALGVGVAWASADWSNTKDAVERLKARQIELRKLTPEETRKIVTAACAVDDVERKAVATDAAERVARTVNEQTEQLRNIRDYAYRSIDEVLADQSMKDRWDEAKQMREDVAKRWTSIEMMAERAMKGGNHPLVAYLVQQGQLAHDDYQRSCDVKEFSTGSRIADCIMATGETCTVIELKPDNSAALSKGKSQLKQQIDELNSELQKPGSSIIKALIDKKSDFAKCKRFEGRLDCYKLCPAVDDEGQFREARPDWRKDCS